MKVAIVPIGNSKGVRLPKAVLEQVGLSSEAELSVEGGRIVLTPVFSRRRGWQEAFSDAELSGEDLDWIDAHLTEDGP